MAVAPPRNLEQRRRALLEANRIRFYRAELKRRLAAGESDALDVLAAPAPELATMPLLDLLRAVPGIGVVKANRIIVAVRVSPSRTLGGLTERQRRELAVAIARIARRR